MVKGTDFDLKDPKLVDYLDKNHAELRFERWSPAIAWDLGCALRQRFIAQYGEDKGKGAVIAIRMFDGHVLFTCVVGDPKATSADNWTWVQGKENVVKRTGKSSFLMGRLFELQGRDPSAKGMPFPTYACHGGGYPVWLTNNTAGPVGTILVSGLPQNEDHQLIVDELEEFLPKLKQQQ